MVFYRQFGAHLFELVEFSFQIPRPLQVRDLYAAVLGFPHAVHRLRNS